MQDNYIRLRWRNLDGETIFKCEVKKTLGTGDFEHFMDIVRQTYEDNVLNLNK